MKELQAMRIYRPDLAFWTWQWEITIWENEGSRVYRHFEKYDDPVAASKAMLKAGEAVA